VILLQGLRESWANNSLAGFSEKLNHFYMKQSGNDYDPEWIEHQFKTQILPYCEERPDSHDLDAVENAFFACLKEGLAPKPVIDSLKGKLQLLLQAKTEAKLPTQAI
jgi:hypothetical protein